MGGNDDATDRKSGNGRLDSLPCAQAAESCFRQRRRSERRIAGEGLLGCHFNRFEYWGAGRCSYPALHAEHHGRRIARNACRRHCSLCPRFWTRLGPVARKGEPRTVRPNRLRAERRRERDSLRSCLALLGLAANLDPARLIHLDGLPVGRFPVTPREAGKTPQITPSAAVAQLAERCFRKA